MLWTADNVEYSGISMVAAYSGETLIWKKMPDPTPGVKPGQIFLYPVVTSTTTGNYATRYNWTFKVGKYNSSTWEVIGYDYDHWYGLYHLNDGWDMIGFNQHSFEDYYPLEILQGCFAGEYMMKKIVLPNQIEALREGCFSACTYLEDIECHATTAPYLDGTHIFDGVSSTGTLRIPSGSDYSTWISALPSGWTVSYIS